MGGRGDRRRRRQFSPGRASRGGRTRTCNLRFWRPLLCQLSYAPSLIECSPRLICRPATRQTLESAFLWVRRAREAESGRFLPRREIQSHANGRPVWLDVYLEVGHERPHQREPAQANVARLRTLPPAGVRHDQEKLLLIPRAPDGHSSLCVLDRVRRGFVDGEDDRVSLVARCPDPVEPVAESASKCTQTCEIRRERRFEGFHDSELSPAAETRNATLRFATDSIETSRSGREVIRAFRPPPHGRPRRDAG